MTEREALKLALEALEDLGMKHYERLVHLGYFDTAQEAHDVYVKFLGEKYGQFARFQ